MSPARISRPVGTCGSSIERGLQSRQAKLFQFFNNVPYFLEAAIREELKSSMSDKAMPEFMEGAEAWLRSDGPMTGSKGVWRVEENDSEGLAPVAESVLEICERTADERSGPK